MTASRISIAALFAACAVLHPARAESTLTVAWYGGAWGDAFKACVADPFTKATGIRVVPEVGTSTTTLAKLQQQRGSPTIDVAWMDGGISELAFAAGTVDDLSGLANLAHVLPQAVYKANGMTYAVGTGYYSLGIAYNTQKVKQAPVSWEDLWKPDFADQVAIPAPANSGGVPFLIFLGQIWKAPPGDLAPVFARLKALNASLTYDSAGVASNAFQTGEVIIGALFSVNAWDLADKGLPIGYVVPKEGAWATDARFIDTALTPAASACLAQKLYLGPSVAGTQVPPDTARKLPWGEHGSVADLRLYDWTAINQQRPQIVDGWNREIAHR
jgi:putative spermidine/putrescine transport system substrate-binding protein